MIQETTSSLAETLTLHSSIRQLVRDEDRREFELDLCSCSCLVKIVGAACLLLCWWSGARAPQHPIVRPRISQTVIGKKTIALESVMGVEGGQTAHRRSFLGASSAEASAVLARGGARAVSLRLYTCFHVSPTLLHEKVKPYFFLTALLFWT